MSASLVTLKDIDASVALVREKLHRTPLLSAQTLGQRNDVELYFKAELFQKTGSFKPRGILYRISRLTEEEKAHGVITISAGNAAQAVAYGAQQMGIPATVLMSEKAVQSKVDATRGYGANVILHGQSMTALMPKMLEIQAEQGQIFVPPFDDMDIIAGHGTLGYEILEDLPDVDTVVVSIGGGGLIAGIAAAIKQKNPNVRMIGVEPVGASVMIPSVEQGKAYTIDSLNTIADGLAAPFAGEHTLRHVQAFVDELVLVTDDEIRQALHLIVERSKLVAEPSAAASYAALLFEKFSLRAGEKIVCVLSGGNIDPAVLKAIL